MRPNRGSSRSRIRPGRRVPPAAVGSAPIAPLTPSPMASPMARAKRKTPLQSQAAVATPMAAGAGASPVRPAGGLGSVGGGL
jgi:hypothetical protein